MSSATPDAFDAWLRRQLQVRRMSQRQLAERSGVDHSTISRLLGGRRVPSLRTAVSLAHGLGLRDPATTAEAVVDRRMSRPAAVEYALRSDPALDDGQIRMIMDAYLAARRTRLVPVSRPAPARARPVPIVVEVTTPTRPMASSEGGFGCRRRR